MDPNGNVIDLLADLDDPWVAEIRCRLASLATVHAYPCADELPPWPFAEGRSPQVIVVHRCRLTSQDLLRIEAWRKDSRVTVPPRIIVCHSPYVRSAELERCSRFAELVIPEATATETLARHIRRLLAPESGVEAGEAWLDSHPALPLKVLSSDHELRAMLQEALKLAGFSVTAKNDSGIERGFGPVSESSRLRVLTVWDVPVLEPDWPQLLRQQSSFGPVIALLGFADRETVARAKAAGAAACLDLPCDLDDLVHVALRVSTAVRSEGPAVGLGRIEPAHAIPPGPVSRGARGRAAIRGRGALVPWPDDGPAPKITS
jgi:hypothetical protein